MPYWVHGTDTETGEPAEMLSDADTQDAAVNQALDQGIRAERVQKAADPRRRNQPTVAIHRPGLTAGMFLGTAFGILVAVLWGDATRWIDTQFGGVAAVLTYLSLPTILFALGWQLLSTKPVDENMD